MVQIIFKMISILKLPTKVICISSQHFGHQGPKGQGDVHLLTELVSLKTSVQKAYALVCFQLINHVLVMVPQ